MSGYVAMSRDWHEHGLFAGDEYSRRDAWSWMIANAAWRPTRVRIKGEAIELRRGELCFALRFLAEKWGWSKSKVDRFLAALRSEGMIETRSKTGTTAGQGSGQGQTIISICNYETFQLATSADRDNENAQTGTTAGQQRDKEEPSKPDNQEPEEDVNRASAATEYAFQGAVIRLKPDQFDRWQKAFPDLSLPAKLQQRDDWLASEADEKLRKKWFIPTSNWLAKEQQKASAAEREPLWDGMA